MDWSIGNTLPNGAEIMDYSNVSGGTAVIARWHKNGRFEYVSWVADSDGNCEHGFYGADYAAVADRHYDRVSVG